MWFLSENGRSSYLILILLGCTRICHGSVIRRDEETLPVGPIKYQNLTAPSSIASNTNSWTTDLENETVSPLPETSSATPTTSEYPYPTTASSDLSTITPAPQWGDQVIPINTCSHEASGGVQYDPCRVSAGTVRLSYFPENSGNVTYPSTWYNPELSITMTSPSIYMVVNTISGSNKCGALGPTYSNKVISMLISDVSTLQPYANKDAHTRLGPERQLTLSDFENCPKSQAEPAHDKLLSAIFDPHPVKNTFNRCNPHLVMPYQMKELGFPYWNGCGAANYEIGIFDPPGAVPSVLGFFATTAPIVAQTPSPPPANPIPTALPDQASSTPPVPVPTTTPINTPIVNRPSPKSSQSPSPSQGPSPNQSPSASLAPEPGQEPASSQVAPPLDTPTTSNPSTSFSTSTASENPKSEASPTALAPTPTSLHGVTDIQTPKAPPTPTETVVASLAVSDVSQASPTSSTSAPAPSPTPIEATAPGQSTGTVTTGIASAAQSTVIGTLGSLTVTATAGASQIAVGGQTVTIGGSLVTLDNSAVVTAASTEVIVQIPGGQVSTFVLPTTIANGPVAGGYSTTSGNPEPTSSSPGIASIIASIAGIPAPAPAPPSSVSTSTPVTAHTVSLSTGASSSSSSLPTGGGEALTSPDFPSISASTTPTTASITTPPSSPSTDDEAAGSNTSGWLDQSTLSTTLEIAPTQTGVRNTIWTASAGRIVPPEWFGSVMIGMIIICTMAGWLYV